MDTDGEESHDDELYDDEDDLGRLPVGARSVGLFGPDTAPVVDPSDPGRSPRQPSPPPSPSRLKARLTRMNTKKLAIEGMSGHDVDLVAAAHVRAGIIDGARGASGVGATSGGRGLCSLRPGPLALPLASWSLAPSSCPLVSCTESPSSVCRRSVVISGQPINPIRRSRHARRLVIAMSSVSLPVVPAALAIPPLCSCCHDPALSCLRALPNPERDRGSDSLAGGLQQLRRVRL